MGCTDRMVDEAFGFGPDDHSGRYEILHEEDGWWTVYRKAFAVESFTTRDEDLEGYSSPWLGGGEDEEAEARRRETKTMTAAIASTSIGITTGEAHICGRRCLARPRRAK